MRYVALVLAVVLAGCGGIADSGLEPESDSVEPGAEAEAGTEIGAGTGGGSTSSIVTPAPVPAVSTPAIRRSVAPGLTRSDVRNASLLADAHVDALSNRSYTVRQNVTRRSTDGRLRSRSVSVARLNGSRFRYAIDGFDRNRTGEPSEYRVERFFDGRRVLGATTRDGETTYSLDRDRNGSEARASVLGDPTNARAVERQFDAFEMRVAGTTERNGSTLYTVVTTRPQRLAPLANVTLRAPRRSQRRHPRVLRTLPIAGTAESTSPSGSRSPTSGQRPSCARCGTSGRSKTPLRGSYERDRWVVSPSLVVRLASPVPPSLRSSFASPRLVRQSF